MATRKLSPLLQRLLDSGYPVDLKALDRKFNFTIFPQCSSGVDLEVVYLFKKKITELIDKYEFACELSDIVVKPIIVEPEVRSVKFSVRRKAQQNAYSIAGTLDIERWRVADRNDKLEIFKAWIERSIKAIPDKHLSDSSKTRLIEIVGAASTAITRGGAHEKFGKGENN